MSAVSTSPTQHRQIHLREKSTPGQLTTNLLEASTTQRLQGNYSVIQVLAILVRTFLTSALSRKEFEILGVCLDDF